MIPDVIVCWPRNCDYPLWRQYIRDNRKQFNEIVVAFTETNQGEDFRNFVMGAMGKDYVHFVQPQEVGKKDWRDVAIKAALLHSYNASWVWFTEQDFFPGVRFWKTVSEMEEAGYSVIGVKQGERLHPCSLLINRQRLNTLRLDFGIVPDMLDHFGLIQKELEKNSERIAIVPATEWMHLNGLSHNWSLISSGGSPNWQPELFKKYLQECMSVSVPLDARFSFVAESFLRR